jgi:hypothetical protein
MNTFRKCACGLVLMALLLPRVVGADNANAMYSVTFTATWSGLTHPHPSFPAQPQFSRLIGGVHSAQVHYWKVGRLPSPGIKLMAEQGDIDTLASEVNVDIRNGRALAVLSRPAGLASPGKEIIDAFEVNRDFPLVTLVTMFSPTPDWFTGVSGLSLLDGQGHWIESEVVMLYPYDAGTQQNGRYALHQPPEPRPRPIYSLSGSEWFTTEPVGSFTFTRIK